MIRLLFRRNSDAGVFTYLLGPVDSCGNRRTVAPELLFGDPELFGEHLRNCRLKQKYLSGALSWSESLQQVGRDAVNEVVQDAVGLLCADRDTKEFFTLGVLHERERGFDAHFVIGKTHLPTGLEFPLYSNSGFDRRLGRVWTNCTNLSHGWTNPDDRVGRSMRDFPGKYLDADERAQFVEIDEAVTDLVAAGIALNRDEVVGFLAGIGFSVLPHHNCIDVAGKTTPRSLRFKGAKYCADADYAALRRLGGDRKNQSIGIRGAGKGTAGLSKELCEKRRRRRSEFARFDRPRGGGDFRAPEDHPARRGRGLSAEAGNRTQGRPTSSDRGFPPEGFPDGRPDGPSPREGDTGGPGLRRLPDAVDDSGRDVVGDASDSRSPAEELAGDFETEAGVDGLNARAPRLLPGGAQSRGRGGKKVHGRLSDAGGRCAVDSPGESRSTGRAQVVQVGDQGIDGSAKVGANDEYSQTTNFGSQLAAIVRLLGHAIERIGDAVGRERELAQGIEKAIGFGPGDAQNLSGVDRVDGDRTETTQSREAGFDRELERAFSSLSEAIVQPVEPAVKPLKTTAEVKAQNFDLEW